jgi:hypothetical protein
MTSSYTDTLFDFLSYQIPVALCATIMITSPLMQSLIPNLWHYWIFSQFFVFIWFCVVLMWFALDVVVLSVVYALDVVVLSVVYAVERAFKRCQSGLSHNNKGDQPCFIFR